MMWSTILPFLLLVKATLGETECSQNPFEFCSHPKLFHMIPQTVSKYNKLCPDLPKYIECLKRFQVTCEAVVFFDSDEEYEKLHDFYSELCEEGSLLNTIITENLKCLNKTFDSSLCSDETQTLLHEFKSRDSPNGGDLFMDFECLKSVYGAACMTANLSKKCGAIVKEAAYDVIRRSNFLQYSCPTQLGKRLLDDPRTTELQTKYQDFFYTLLGEFSDNDSGSGY
ncbi:hypothetical protein HNY73_017265 [Argiope bruennichi]|uniref:DUF19 domain-containing protein n=1 Tax=Argiope bruennichi TaxID=94029 RepID=A0A8T0EQ19_ARGBR|nr:hypothetical protein HNY73_017265 [Argiope bruennichi]